MFHPLFLLNFGDSFSLTFVGRDTGVDNTSYKEHRDDQRRDEVHLLLLYIPSSRNICCDRFDLFAPFKNSFFHESVRSGSYLS